MPDILIITVNYKAADSTESFVRSASLLDGFDRVQVMIVENGSLDGSAGRLEPIVRKFSNVDLLQSADNRGYFGAANWALRRCLACGHKPKWVIVCNNDIIFDDRQFLLKLLQRDARSTQVIAPAIIDRTTGIDCNPFLRNRPSRLKLLRYRFWHSSYRLMWFQQWVSPYVRTARHYLNGRRRAQQTIPEPVYAPHGAFCIFSESYFSAGGYIDDGFFLYAEEFSVAEICWQLNLRVLHDPDLRVWHEAHRVTGRMCNRTTYEYGRQGLQYALKKYFLADSNSPLQMHASAGSPTDSSLHTSATSRHD